MQQARNSNPGTPAPYGRACTNCSRAKCKCIYRSEGGRCERCHRLNKDCQPSIPVRKRNAKKPAGSKTAQLEEKLDDLVALLRSQAVAKTAHSTPSTSGPSTSGPDGLGSDRGHATETSPSSLQASPPYEDDSSPPYAVCPPPPGPLHPTHWGTLLETDIPEHAAEQNLAMFRTCMLQYFPFVFIAPGVTATELRQRRPFLWFCIMANTTKSLQRQVLMAQQIRSAVAQKVVVESERTMDLLLGLLCYLGWSHYHKTPGKEKPYLSLWTQIAIAIVYDLGLHKPPPGQSQPLTFRTFWNIGKQPLPPPTERTMEERRAIASIFLISCMLSTIMRKGPLMPWTPHMEDCLRTLWEHPEWEGDKILAIQTRCHLITSQLDSWQCYSGEGESVKPPPSYFIKPLLSQLQDIKRSIPADLEQNQTVLMFIHSTELAIRETEVSYAPPQTSNGISEHLKGLWACVQSIHAWFDVYFRIPISLNIGVTFNIFTQLSHCFIALYRLSTLQDPIWDKSLLRRNLDVVALMERFAGIMNEIPEVAGLVSDPTSSMADQTIYTKVAKVMQQMAVNWRSELDGEPATAAPEGQTGQSVTLGSETVTDDVAMDFTIDPWLSDLFSSWEPQRYIQ